jgi:hypothetical protein
MVLVPADKLQEYAEQSLTTPAAPPAPVAEPVDENAQPQGNTDDTNNPNNQQKPPSNDPQKPATKPDPTTGANGKGNASYPTSHTKQEDVLSTREHDLSTYRRYTRALDTVMTQKTMDVHGIYQPDNLDKQLKALQDKGVKRIMWDADVNPCDTCSINNTQIVELGQPFYSGHILPPAHPHCECKVTPSD